MQATGHTQTIPTKTLETEIVKLTMTLENLEMFGISQARLDYLIRDAESLIASARGTRDQIQNNC